MILKSAIRSAVILHHESWTASDEALMEDVKTSGELTKETAEKHLKEYRISRWLAKTNENGAAIDYGTEFAKAVNQFSKDKNYPNLTMLLKAGKCLAAAKELNDVRKVTTKVHVSAITKLAWFVQPIGWTMFDSHAAFSVGATESKARSVSRCEDFYDKLERREFLVLSKKITAILRKHSLNSLYGERVIDKFLWLYGAPLLTAERIFLDHKKSKNKNEIPAELTKATGEIESDLAVNFDRLLKGRNPDGA